MSLSTSGPHTWLQPDQANPPTGCTPTSYLDVGSAERVGPFTSCAAVPSGDYRRPLVLDLFPLTSQVPSLIPHLEPREGGGH